jgi:integrase
MDAEKAERLNMATDVEVEGLHKVTAKGRVYLYAWRGGPRLKAKPGSAEFVAELAAAHASRKTADPRKMLSLCGTWRNSAAWQAEPAAGGLAASTKKNWRPFLKDIEDYFGGLSIAQFERTKTIRPIIKKWRNSYKPALRQADMAKQVLSSLLTFGVEEDLLESNPCIGIANLYASNRADRIWTAEDLAKLAGKASAEIMHAARLAALTGLRQGDLMRLNWSHVGPLAIEIETGKSGRRRVVTLIPIYAELRQLLATIPKRSTVILTNQDGRPWRTGFASSWNKALISAGLKDADLHFHDLRGTAATKLYVAGLTPREIAEIMAWSEDQVERLLDRYVKREELLRDRIARLDAAARRKEGTEE